ncbi:MAG: response regulator [Novosphingobium sp.]|uniref:response regulator n=1 Tax=Novosphingobium sp. TaxID=1874826 RepID=UPI003C7ED09C
MKTEPPLVLVVDDEVLIALDVAMTLEDAGYRVLGPALTLEAAMDLIEREKPDAAVLDINIGSRTVWPLAKRLSECRVPMVFASANLGHRELQEEFSDQPRLSKPVSGHGVLSTLKDCFGLQA